MENMNNLLMYLALAFIISWPLIRAQPTGNSSRSSLDALLQNYAYEAIAARPRTGKVFDAEVPSNFSGMKLAALRLRSGSLKSKGVKNFKNIELPPGVAAQPYLVRLVLVYQNLGNWSDRYYGISGYTFLTSVIGLLAYDASNLSATNLPELDFRASKQSISIHFANVKKSPSGSTPKCVWFHLNGSFVLSNMTSRSSDLCWTTGQGHFSILAKSISPISPSSPGVNPGKKDKWRLWKIAAPVIGGSALLVLLALLVLYLRNYRKIKKMEEMELQTEMGEALRMTPIGGSKAPMAMVTRTPPMLETEYVP